MTSKSLSAVAAVAAFGCVLSSASGAAAPGPKARIFAEFDQNKNGVIDGDEIAAVRRAFAAAPKGPFATYDKNADGKLDDAEIAAIKPPGQKNGKGKKQEKGGSKKSPSTATPSTGNP